MRILITGGAGYIGSHTTLVLLKSGYDVVVVDNLCNSSSKSLSRISDIIGCPVNFIQGDVRDHVFLDKVFSMHSVDAVIHFAGLKAVGESVSHPLSYYDNNVHGTQVLLEAMADAGIYKFVFSSSATVYGEPITIPIPEFSLLRPENPYGRSKLMTEEILRDLAASDPRWRIAILRYFNPVGAHESGLIGEDPSGVPNNLLPYIAQVAVGRLPELVVFGNDYPTPDGTGVRDYIHVMDLAEGHLKALDALKSHIGVNVWNLGAGRGISVLEMIRAFEGASGVSIPFRIAPRRPGDIATCYSDPSEAEHKLHWNARRNLSEIMRDAWNWQSRNPNGYKS